MRSKALKTFLWAVPTEKFSTQKKNVKYQNE